jgi:hypothetical protein
MGCLQASSTLAEGFFIFVYHHTRAVTYVTETKTAQE